MNASDSTDTCFSDGAEWPPDAIDVRDRISEHSTPQLD
jgi:hypothetical protein